MSVTQVFLQHGCAEGLFRVPCDDNAQVVYRYKDAGLCITSASALSFFFVFSYASVGVYRSYSAHVQNVVKRVGVILCQTVSLYSATTCVRTVSSAASAAAQYARSAEMSSDGNGMAWESTCS